jgi:hypothetical protein
MEKIVFLGYFIAAQGIEMDKKKVTAMWIVAYTKISK